MPLVLFSIALIFLFFLKTLSISYTPNKIIYLKNSRQIPMQTENRSIYLLSVFAAFIVVLANLECEARRISQPDCDQLRPEHARTIAKFSRQPQKVIYL